MTCYDAATSLLFGGFPFQNKMTIPSHHNIKRNNEVKIVFYISDEINPPLALQCFPSTPALR